MCAARHGRIEAGLESIKRGHILFPFVVFWASRAAIWCMYNAVAGTSASSSCSSCQQVVQLLLESSADPVWCWAYLFEDIFLTGIGQHFFLLTRKTVARQVRTDMLGRTALVRSSGLDEASHPLPLPIRSLNLNFLSRSHEEEVPWPRDKQWGTCARAKDHARHQPAYVQEWSWNPKLHKTHKAHLHTCHLQRLQPKHSDNDNDNTTASGCVGIGCWAGENSKLVGTGRNHTTSVCHEIPKVHNWDIPWCHEMRDCSNITTDGPFSRDTFPIFGQERMVQVGNPVQRKIDVTIYGMNQLLSWIWLRHFFKCMGYLTTFFIA